MAWLSSLRLFDLLDILIISALFYQLYMLLNGSRAWNVFRGLAALAGVWFMASQLDLSATAWIFDRAAPVGFIALVVIFQPELRAVLERVGQGRVNRAGSQDPLQEVMSAVRDLAAKHTGALIAIERQTPLDDYGSVGTPLGSTVSAALLQTIFDSKGPLHDGGVIIKGDVVTYAGAIFPLTNADEGWSIKHGTRHRAAVGLSEVSDALVLIVSEERGTVSVAQAGELRSDIAPSDVLRALRAVYTV
ncbi:MAG: diadenylate cyclase CdaA [Deinococcota bacterium]